MEALVWEIILKLKNAITIILVSYYSRLFLYSYSLGIEFFYLFVSFLYNNHLGFEYKTLIVDQTQICEKDNGNKIRSVGYSSKQECEEACNANSDCSFYSLTTANLWCNLYKMCTESKRIYSYAVSIYQKTEMGRIQKIYSFFGIN